MSTATLPPSGAHAHSPDHAHPRHLLGSALRAIRVFVKTVFQVVVLGSENKRY